MTMSGFGGSNGIEAVFLDLGNTLRMLVPDEDYQRRARERITRLLGTDEDPKEFILKLDQRYKEYRTWAFQHLREASAAELWTRWMAPDFPPERILQSGPELSLLYRQAKGNRVMVEGGKDVILELYRRGYVLGIISNVTTTQEIPDWLEEEQLTPYFKSVVLSSVLGIRKPDPQIYLEAARKADVAPEKCAYIGDNLKRDVTGTRAAGFGMSVIFISPEELSREEITAENQPDAIIHSIRDLLVLFPG